MSQRPLNVFRIISYLPIGGVENTLLLTLPKFDRERFHISVCCLNRKGPVAAKLEEQGVPVHLCKVSSRLNPIHLWRLSRFLIRQKADIVHTHMYASNISGALAAHLAGAPVIISHIHATHEWNSWNRIFMERIVNRFRDGVITVSQSVKDAFLQKTRLKCADKIRTLHNPVRFSNEGTGNGGLVREEFGIPMDAPVVGAVARLVPVKGVDIFIRAAAHILKRRPSARFLVVGKGKERKNLEALALQLNLNGKLFFAGERSRIEDFYDAFNVFVLSSREEGFGNVLLEAMHFDLPVVATATGGVPEVALDGKTGLLVPPESPESLANAVLSALEQPERAQRLAQEARKRLVEFSPDKYVAYLENYYQELWDFHQRTAPRT
ncbi:glycosyltransferase [Candidatus Sumerlaeota bacterium]|nr:glycosyltransferase [Candidatus Sumerlaeota bacterium]